MQRADQREHLRMASRVAGVEATDLTPPEDRHLVLDGIRLHYLDWGAPAYPCGAGPLVFLHGGFLTAHSWDIVCLALRHRYHCLALDQRGHGDSEWSPTLDYEPDAHAGDLAALVRELRLVRPVLIGQSMGGLNALTYATRPDAAAAALAIVDVTPDVSDTGTRRIVDFVSGPAELDSIEAFAERAHAFNPRRDPLLLRHSLQHNLRRLPSGRWTWKYDRRAITAGAFERVKRELPALRERLTTVTVPTLIVRGEDSDVVTDADARRFAADLPAGRFACVADAGHTVQGDNPRGLAAALDSFLTDASR